MPINFSNGALAAGVGVLDEVMEYWDEQEARTEAFKTARDISRVFLVLGSLGIQAFAPRYERFAEPIGLASIPLLVKSISKPVRDAIGGGTTTATSRVYRPSARAVPAAQINPALRSSSGAPVRSQVPEFQHNRLV